MTGTKEARTDAIEVPPIGECLDVALRFPLGDLAEIPQHHAASRTGMRQPNIARVIKGDRRLRWDTVYRLIVTLRLDLSRFFPADLVILSADAVRSRTAEAERHSIR